MSKLAEEIVGALFIESLEGAFLESQLSIVDQKLSGVREALKPFQWTPSSRPELSDAYETLKVE